MTLATMVIGSIQQISKELARIKRVNKNLRHVEYRKLCESINENKNLLSEYYSRSPYTGQHIELAAQVYIVFGPQIYRTVKTNIPKVLGKRVSGWDEFMLAQIDKIAYAVWHTQTIDGKYPFHIFSRFVVDIEELCDDDLYVEMMCRIARTYERPFVFYKPHQIDPRLLKNNKVQNELDPKQFVIDYNFIESRYKTMDNTLNSMNRFLYLFAALADYDLLSAMKAWGDFYRLFKDSKKNIGKYRFTGKIYYIMFNCIRHELECKYCSELDYSPYSDYHKINQEAEDILSNDYIRPYGWKYLQNAFEVDIYCNAAIVYIYEKLTIPDKNKADAIIDKCFLEPNESEDEIPALANAIIADVKSGFLSWQNSLRDFSRTKRITKVKSYRYLDKIAIAVREYQIYNNITCQIANPHASLIYRETQPICVNILNNDWIAEYYFRHCQSYGCAVECLSIALFTEQIDKYEHYMTLLSNNLQLKVSVDYVRERVRHDLSFLSDIIIKRAKYDEWIESPLGDEVVYLLGREQKVFRFKNHPELIDQANYITSLYLKHT